MIFVLHYILFNAGLPPVLVLITLFLKTYSDASLSEIGALLMALPFVSILIKPLFCALADRQQAHKLYLMCALALMALGYGSLTIAPFFADIIEQHGRIVWYFDIIGVIIGFSAFGVIWSLGDALSVNHAQMRGVTWGTYRVWGVISWGVFGVLIGQINEVSFLPKFVPAFFVLVVALLTEIILLAVWPNKHFVMGGTLDDSKKPIDEKHPNADLSTGADGQHHLYEQQIRDLEDNWSSANKSLAGTLRGTARANPRMIGAVANIFMEDISGSLRSSFNLGSKPKRTGLNEILEQHQVVMQPTAGGEGAPASAAPGLSPSGGNHHISPPNEAAGAGGGTPNSLNTSSALSKKHSGATFGRGTLRRAQMSLASMNSLSAASGHVIADEVNANMNSFASDTVGRAAAARMFSLQETSLAPTNNAANKPEVGDGKQQVDVKSDERKQDGVANGKSDQLRSPEDLQLLLLKLIVRRDTKIWKYLVMFTIFGSLLTCHLSYFFLHMEQLCREHGHDFSSVTSGMVAAHSVSEVFSFTFVVPYVLPRIGRSGALLSCAIIYAARFAYYGTYLSEASPYTAIPFELAHGIVYGIVYSLITDIACECVNQVDLYLPELVERGLVDPSIDPNLLKLQLRATMQGLFSGAFDGLGNGIGALFGGVYLDSQPFSKLWQFCTYVCLVTIVVYPLTEWNAFFGKSSHKQDDSKQAKC